MREDSIEISAFRPLEEQIFTRLEDLERDVESLTAQVAQDFEELVLLQSLGTSMTFDSADANPIQILKNALSMLPDAAQTEGIALIPNASVLSELLHEHQQVETIWSGERSFSESVVREVLERFGTQSQGRPYLHNEPATFADGITLQEFILVEIGYSGRCFGWLLGCNHRHARLVGTSWTQQGFSTIEGGLLQTAASFLGTQLHNLRLLRLKERMFMDVVGAMVGALEARDPYTCGHSERVALFATALSQQLGKSPADCERIHLTGLLHDIGKIAVPDAVLRKPGALAVDERELMETHADAGWRILQPLQQLKEVLPGVLYHHERFDGKGYPDGLIGKQIPEDGRILAVCDAYDAMTSDRPYRKGMVQEKAEAILREGAGEYWDPDFVSAFMETMPTIIEIRNSYKPRTPEQRQIFGNPQRISGDS